MRPLTFPVIHLNGSFRKTLFGQYETAWNALNTAVAAVTETYPHGRDYYIRGMDYHNAAISEHTDRIQKLLEVRDEIGQILTHLREEDEQ